MYSDRNKLSDLKILLENIEEKARIVKSKEVLTVLVYMLLASMMINNWINVSAILWKFCGNHMCLFKNMELRIATIQFARFSLQQKEYGILGHLTLAETVPTC